MPDAVVSGPDLSNTPSYLSWLGGYLGRPASTTTITYGSGIASSPPNSSARSVASTAAPDADEHFPEATLAVPAQDAPNSSSSTLHRRNPLVDAVPLSSWSSFFTTRHIYPAKRIEETETSIAEPESMVVDFDTAPTPPVPDSASATPKDKRADKPAITLGDAKTSLSRSSSMLRLDSVRSATTAVLSAAATIKGGEVAAGTKTPPRAAVETVAPTTVDTGSTRMKPLTTDKDAAKGQTKSTSLNGPSSASARPSRPNLVLPSFEDTFHTPPRSHPPARINSEPTPSKIKKAVAKSFTYLFSSNLPKPSAPKDDKGKTPIVSEKCERLPKALSIVGETANLRSAGRVCVIGVHGWFIQSYLSQSAAMSLMASNRGNLY